MCERKRERERERERTSGLSQSVCFFVVVFFPTSFVSCNGPCAPKEKWHRKECIIIIIIIIIERVLPTLAEHHSAEYFLLQIRITWN